MKEEISKLTTTKLRSQNDNSLRRNSSIALTSTSLTPNILICKNDICGNIENNFRCCKN